MNLFYQSPLSEFQMLVNSAAAPSGKFNILVDFDGEVIPDFENNTPGVERNKYRICITDIPGRVMFRSPGSRENLKLLNRVYKNLRFCWEENINGKINNSRVFRLRKEKIRESAISSYNPIEDYEIIKRTGFEIQDIRLN